MGRIKIKKFNKYNEGLKLPGPKILSETDIEQPRYSYDEETPAMPIYATDHLYDFNNRKNDVKIED